MPCDQIILNTVELENVTNHDLLEKALQGAFGQVTRRGDQFQFRVNGYPVTLAGGRAVSRMPESALQETVGQIKQAYSREQVQASARRFGWEIKKTSNPNKFKVIKR